MNDELRTDPLPLELAGMLDYDRITAQMGDYMGEDEFWHSELENDRLSWVKEPFDDQGRALVLVMHKRSGQIVASATVHWSALFEGA
jgi:hypothetical protein